MDALSRATASMYVDPFTLGYYCWSCNQWVPSNTTHICGLQVNETDRLLGEILRILEEMNRKMGGE